MASSAYDTAILLLRVVLGLTMAAHGYNKFFGGGRIKGTAGWFESIGMKPGTFHARVAASTELSAGLGLAVLSRHTLVRDPSAEGLAVLPVAGFPLRRQWHLVWRQDRALSLPARTLLHDLRTRLGVKARPAG